MTLDNKIKALFVDVDDTLIRFKSDSGVPEARRHGSGSLFWVLLRAGTELSGLAPEEVSRRIAFVKENIVWWNWTDFIGKLDINPERFWEFAYQVESEYIEPSGDEILTAFRRIQNSGVKMFVTSNNPNNGILHKLRLAGLGNFPGTPFFHQLLGATELRSMKWEPVYWERALAHTGLKAYEVAVVGDNIRDDCEIPAMAGIRTSFIIDRAGVVPPSADGKYVLVNNFNDIAEFLLTGTMTPECVGA
jgi:FMN phosphatase YigB (HAD superfamily)